MNDIEAKQGAELQQSLSLPADIEIVEYLGKGGRAHVFKAKLGEDSVVVKLYRPSVVQKYQQKYGLDIAEFEFQRNQALYQLEQIKSYIAKPYRLYPASSEYSQSIVQEWVTGKTLKAIVAELGYLPEELLDTGYEIIKHAEAHGLHDLDISSGNTRVSQLDGQWREIAEERGRFTQPPQVLRCPRPGPTRYEKARLAEHQKMDQATALENGI